MADGGWLMAGAGEPVAVGGAAVADGAGRGSGAKEGCAAGVRAQAKAKKSEARGIKTVMMRSLIMAGMYKASHSSQQIADGIKPRPGDDVVPAGVRVIAVVVQRGRIGEAGGVVKVN